MAHQTVVAFTDDLDGGRAAETVVFGLDGSSYEIDLSQKNAAALREALAEFVEHVRRVKADRPASVRNQKHPVPRSGPSPAAVRDWAATQGIAVSSRGRISAEVVTQYEAAHPG